MCRYIVVMLFSIYCHASVMAEVGEEVDVVRLYATWHKYTIAEGKLGLAGVNVLGMSTIEEFQEQNALKKDGIVGPETLNAIKTELEAQGWEIVKNQDAIKLNMKIHKGGLDITFTNQTTRAMVIDIGNADIYLKIKYSGTGESGVHYQVGKNIPLSFDKSKPLQAMGTINNQIPLDSFLPSNTSAKIWFECVVAYSNKIFLLSSVIDN